MEIINYNAIPIGIAMPERVGEGESNWCRGIGELESQLILLKKSV
jgi:hypothetical protein